MFKLMILERNRIRITVDNWEIESLEPIPPGWRSIAMLSSDGGAAPELYIDGFVVPQSVSVHP